MHSIIFAQQKYCLINFILNQTTQLYEKKHVLMALRSVPRDSRAVRLGTKSIRCRNRRRR